MNAPSPEYRSTLDAALLMSMASVVISAEQHGLQFVLPGHRKAKLLSRREDVRIITNRSPEENQDVLSQGTQVNTGGYHPYFLDTIEGLKYKVVQEVISKDRNDADKFEKYLESRKERARGVAFGYVEGGHIVSILASHNGEDITDWRKFADVCGLIIGNGPKVSKRLKEIIRTTRMFVRLTRLNIRTFEADYPDLPQKHVDGATLVRERVALKACRDPHTRRGIKSGRIRRVSIRVITPDGLIKGDALIVPNKHLKCDVYTSVHNIKGELRTKEGYVITMEPHHDASPVWTNRQLLSWMPGLFPVDTQRFATRSFLVDALKQLHAGEYPAHMVTLPKVQKEGVDQVAIFSMASHKWIAHGLKLNQTAALVKQAGTAVLNQLISMYPIGNDRGGPYRDYVGQEVHVPIVHAFYGHFMTDVVYRLAGYDIPAGAEGKLFFSKEIGSVVIPAEHFALKYPNHGGWDLDDSAAVILRKIDGEVKAIIVRSPNGWGEYSTIDVHLPGLPLFFEYGDIPEVNSADLPAEIQDLDIVDPDRDRTLPAGSFVREAHYGLRDFDYALECEVANPTVGAAINLTCIAYNAILGDYNHDPLVNTEEIVDSTTQSQSLEAHEKLAEYLDEVKAFLLELISQGQPVDPIILHNHLNLSDREKRKRGFRVSQMRNAYYAKVPGVNLVEGIFSQQKTMALKEYDSYKDALELMSVKERVPLDLSGIDFSSVRGTEQEIWDRYIVASTSAARVMNPERQRALWQGLNRDLVDYVTTKTVGDVEVARSVEERDLILLNFLSWCYQKGRSERALFSTPGVVDGVVEVALMDLLLEALVRRGLATEPEL